MQRGQRKRAHKGRERKKDHQTKHVKRSERAKLEMNRESFQKTPEAS